MRVRAEKPELSVICTSGYGPGILPPGAAVEFLAKPYSLRTLTETVTRVLERMAA